MKLEEYTFTLRNIIKILGISERYVSRLYRGTVSFERPGRYNWRSKARTMEKNQSMTLWTRSRMYKIVKMRKNL